MIYATIYKKLVKLGIVREANDGTKSICKYGKSIVPGYMDLICERVPQYDGETGAKDSRAYAISLAHYFVQEGDLCADPEMVVVIYPASGLAEAFSYQQAIPPIYNVVYSDEGTKVHTRWKEELNAFLNDWLSNCIEQGHGARWVMKKEDAA